MSVWCFNQNVYLYLLRGKCISSSFNNSHLKSVIKCEYFISLPFHDVTKSSAFYTFRCIYRSVESVRCKARRLVLADDHLPSESDDCEESDLTDSESGEGDSEGESDGQSEGWWCNIL